jgi:hypothetical protein
MGLPSCMYRKTSDRSPRLLSVHFALTPGLYPGPGLYAGPGFYWNTLLSPRPVIGTRPICGMGPGFYPRIYGMYV